VTGAAASRAVEAVWRIEAARLIAGLARLVHDVGRAEDLAQDALVAALEQWPASGIPDRPGAWLMTVARRRAVDEIRRDVTLAGKIELLGRELPETDELELPEPVEDEAARGPPHGRAQQPPTVKGESRAQVEPGQQQIDPRKVAEHPRSAISAGAPRAKTSTAQNSAARRPLVSGPTGRDQELVARPARLRPGSRRPRRTGTA
jgi:DNA-directed RNA polymerase specialized sigma24 family protein